MIGAWHIKDYGGNLLRNVMTNSRDIPDPLPWVDPSINCLYKEVVLSYLIGNYCSSITLMCQLLEHTLRAALININDSGLSREDTKSKWDRYNSLSGCIDAGENTIIMKDSDIIWWRAISKNVRNKTAHYIIPILLKNCASEERLRDYISEYELPEVNDDYYYNKYLTDWGSFFHSSGHRLAKHILIDGTIELKKVISNTNWTGDESWWISLKENYNSFFSYNWNRDNLKKSFDKAYGPFGRKEEDADE